MLSVSNLHAWYDRSHILQGIDLAVNPGEIVALIGRNGAGKTTTLRSIMGLVERCRGTVTFEDEELLGEPSHSRFHLGIGFVPEDRRIVSGLSVRENLRLGRIAIANRRRRSRALQRVLAVFPRLRERLNQPGETLSGGEQQMLAIARALVSEPRLLMLDEPSEGIMPVLVDEMFELFGRLRDDGVTLLLVEQNVERALQLADRAYIIDQGKIVYDAQANQLLADQSIQARYCSV